MFIARVTGSVVSTQKADSMIGSKLLIVEPYRINDKSRDSLVTTGRTFIAVDTLASKEALARRFGATDFIDASATADVVAAIRMLLPFSEQAAVGPFNAGGADWVFDVVAHPTVTRNAMEALDWGGTAVIIGVPAPGVETTQSYSRFTHVDRGMIGCRAGSYVPQRDFPLILDLYRRGEFLLDELVTQTYPLEGFDDAVHDMHEGRLARGVLTFA